MVLLVVKARFLEVESSLDFPIERSTWDMEPLALAQKTLQAINMMTQKTMPAQTAATTYHLDALVCFVYLYLHYKILDNKLNTRNLIGSYL